MRDIFKQLYLEKTHHVLHSKINYFLVLYFYFSLRHLFWGLVEHFPKHTVIVSFNNFPGQYNAKPPQKGRFCL